MLIPVGIASHAFLFAGNVPPRRTSTSSAPIVISDDPELRHIEYNKPVACKVCGLRCNSVSTHLCIVACLHCRTRTWKSFSSQGRVREFKNLNRNSGKSQGILGWSGKMISDTKQYILHGKYTIVVSEQIFLKN